MYFFIMNVNHEINKIIIKSQEQHWYVNYDELKIDLEPFASGATSEIFDCLWRGTKIVIKKLKLKDKISVKDFLNEINIWNTVRHPNIVQFLGISIDENIIYLLLQKINGPNLRDFINNRKIIRSNLKIKFMNQLVSIFNFLHNCNPPIIYRDLKAENILVENDNIFLTDFGLSKFYPENENFKMTGNTGTLRYMAPEVFNKKDYNLKADIYSLGMILYFIFKGQLPFNEMSRKMVVNYMDNDKNMLVDLNDNFIKKIVEKCIDKNINNRHDINTLTDSLDLVNFNNYCCLFS